MGADRVIDVVIVMLVGYIAGAIPFSYIAGKLFGGIDLRQRGSGNLGASNTFRLLGGKVALGVLAGDVAKGFLPVHFASALAPSGSVPAHWLGIAAAVSAIMGHMFSVFVGFSGGKGIATTAGAFLALSPRVLLVTLGIFIVVFAAKRIVSLASIASASALPFVVLLLDRTGVEPSHGSLLAASIAIAVVVLAKHRGNMKRLLAGTEPALHRVKR